MSIPIYNAIEFKNVMSKGGSTKPWLLEVLVDESPQPYVVKVFKTDTLNQYPAVTNEVFAHILAKELDLNVPDAAFVEFSNDFIEHLPIDERTLIQSNYIDERHKFATSYIANSQLFSPTLHLSSLDKYNIASIYAFDNLIFNVDRKKEKPNVLFKESDYYLIDHELSISEVMTNSFLQEIQKDKWTYPFQRHIFHSYLQKLRDKIDIFTHFQEILSKIDVNCLHTVAQQLTEYQHDIKHLNILQDYLRFIKANAHIFVKELERQIQ